MIKQFKRSPVRHLLNTAKACIPLFWRQLNPPDRGMMATESARGSNDAILHSNSDGQGTRVLEDL